MRLPLAAAYFDMGETLFLANVRVAPLRIGSAVLWDRIDLDIYITNQKDLDSGTPEDWLSKVA
jgi:hypothetical protein